MPKSFLDVQDEYSQFKSQYPDSPIALGEFAKQADMAQGTNERAQAYNDSWYKRANAVVDRGFEATHLPQLAGEAAGSIGSGFDSLAGTNVAPTLEALGHDTPRMLTEALATIPEVESGVGAPIAAATLANRVNTIRKILGYGGSALGGYAQTESPVGAAISAGSMLGMNKLLLPAERGGVGVAKAAEGYLRDKLGIGGAKIAAEAGSDLASSTPELAHSTNYLKNLIATTGGLGAEAGTMAGLNEATRQADLSVGPNAVGLTDPSRNPLTEENIASNVANMVPFGVHALLGLGNPTGFDTRQAKPLAEWIRNRREAVEATAKGVEGPVTPEQYQDEIGKTADAPTFDPTSVGTKQEDPTAFDFEGELTKPTPKFGGPDMEKMKTSVMTDLDAANSAETHGDTELASHLRQRASDAMGLMGTTPADLPSALEATKSVDTQARMLPPDSPQGLVGFVSKVNSLIDFYNENRVKVEEGELPQSSPTSGPKQAWSPNARDPLVVNRLQEKGLLPKITPDWLKEQYNATLDDLGNPAFAQDVLAQKVSNYLLDNIPQALKQESIAKADTQLSPAVTKINSTEHEFLKALSSFPETLQKALIDQTIKFRNSKDQFIYGRQFNNYDSWQKAVVTAANSYDPVSQTADIYKSGKLSRGSISTLWSKEYQPVLTPVKAGAGGKGIVTLKKKVGSVLVSGKKVPEGNIEDQVKGQEQQGVSDSSFDEMVQEGDIDPLSVSSKEVYSKNTPEKPTKLNEQVVSGVEKDLGIPSEIQRTYENKFYKKSEQLRSTVESLSTPQAWNLMKEVMQGKRAETKNVFREANAKTILQALIEVSGGDIGDKIGPAGQALLDAHEKAGYGNSGDSPRDKVQMLLQNLFKSYQPLEGVSKTTLTPRGDLVVSNRAETALGRQKLVLEKLLDPKAIEAAKTYGGSMASLPQGKNYQYTVQNPHTDPSTGIVTPGYTQIDEIENGKNVRSTNLETLRKEGVDLPNVPQGLASGRYSLKEIQDNTAGETFKNHPMEGTFQRDVFRTIQDAVEKQLGAQGYSGDYKALLGQAIMAVVKQSGDLPLDFYKIQGNEAGLAGSGLTDNPSRGQVGLKVEPSPFESPEQFVHRTLLVLTHELSHIDDFVRHGVLNSPDAFSQERKRQLDNLDSMFNVLSEEDRRIQLTTLDEALNPPGFRHSVKENSSQLHAAVTSPQEFSATIMAMVTNSLLFGKDGGLKNALDTLDYSPTEVREYANFQYRSVRDILKTVESNFSSGKNLPEGINPNVASHAFTALVGAAVEGSKVRSSTIELAAANEMVKAMSQGVGTILPQGPTDATWVRRQAEVGTYFKDIPRGPYAMPNAMDSMGQAREALGMTKGKVKKPGWWEENIYPFGQLMLSMEKAGVDLAKPLFGLINDTPSAIHRRYSDIMSSFIKQDAAGNFKWDDDHPLIKNQTPSVREGINRVSQWQSEHGDVPMFKEVQGELVPDMAARPDWEKIRKGMSLADQQTVQAASLAMDEVGQKMGQHTLSALDESMSVSTARLLMTLDRKLTYDQALGQANMITEAYHSNKVEALRGKIDDATLSSVDNLLGGTDGLISQYDQVKSLYDTRTGYRTEQLPHPWVVMYKDKDGQVKFTSAPSEKQAGYMRDKIVAQGGTQIGDILNKNDMHGKYQAFDDPVTVLDRFSQVEGKLWDKVVQGIRLTKGDEIADQVRDSYTPGEASLKDVTSQGMKRFLKENKSQVDRSQFDYLDAMLSRVNRLSSSLTYKTHGDMKNLILNDPRSKMYPSLGEMVNRQWDNALAPTSQATNVVKTIASTYYLGLNLSSAIVNGSQAVTTVVPALIAMNEKGGPVKAYGQLFRAIADATNFTTSKDWQRLAKVAESKVKMDPDANLSVDETKALMHKRAVAGNILDHGVIQDLLYSQDKKTLELAKFGQGDYGSIPMTNIVGSKMLIGAQLMNGLYGLMSKFHDKVAFFCGLNQGMEKGLKGDDLYNYAQQFDTLSTFRGGKFNSPGWVAKVSNVHTRSAVGMINTLQQYGYGMLAMYGQFGKDSIDANKSLTPQQRNQARKAFGTLLATQVAVGGVLGVPFAGASLALLEKVFGIPANQMVRQGLASMGNDDEEGGVIAETALNGFANQLFGEDLSSRIGVSNLMGTSTYRGFNLQDMLGPVPSVITNMAQGLAWFGKGRIAEGVHSMVPNAFKNAVALADTHAKYGDYSIRDSQDNLLYNPTAGQTIGQALGFRPAQSVEKQVARNLLYNANQRDTQQYDHEEQEIAQQLLQGNSQPAQQYAQNLHYADPTVNTTDVLRGILERAVRATQESDLLASGPKRNAAERRAIMGTFPGDVNERQSEVKLNAVRTQLAAKLGEPKLLPDTSSWSRAAIVDSLVNDKGMTRSQAVALAGMLGL